MSTVVGVVLPGTSVTPIVEQVLKDAPKTKDADDSLPIVKLGGGLIQTGGDVLVVQAGLLHFSKPNKFWIESRQKRYIPVPNDLVIGIITAKMTEAYKLDLGSSCQATLNFTGFEGITKKNRPNLSIGDVVFARVSAASKDLEPELVCLDNEGRAEGFGEVKDGMLFHCPSYYSRKLLMADNKVIEMLGKHFAFEIIVGANGRFILNASRPIDLIKLANIILDSENHHGKEAAATNKWIYERINAIARSS